VEGGIADTRLELSIAFRTSGVVSELAALQRTLNGAIRGGVRVALRVNGSITTIELKLTLVQSTDITPEATSDVLLSA
jgi:hypothetical protein